MEIIQTSTQKEAIQALLLSEKLPVDDLPASLENFFTMVDNEELIGVAGLEIYGSYGLLRSLVVLPSYRGLGIAGKLIGQIESVAKTKGLAALFLLTETAPEYFAGKGFQQISREDVPEAVKASSEFSHVCPVSAIVMKKSID